MHKYLFFYFVIYLLVDNALGRNDTKRVHLLCLLSVSPFGVGFL